MYVGIKILIAEDDPNLGTVLRTYLSQKGYSIFLATNGQMAVDIFKTEAIDLSIVDVMMPTKDGFTVVKEIKEMSAKAPIIFLTAKSQSEDKIKGFEAGADDYITKPFSMEELLMRIQAILRRTKEDNIEGVSIFQIGKYTFDFTRQILVFEGHEQKITSKESELLRVFCMNVNKLVDRGSALHKIWKNDSPYNARSMDVYITKLRKYLKKDPNLEIVNVHGVGFKLCERS